MAEIAYVDDVVGALGSAAAGGRRCLTGDTALAVGRWLFARHAPGRAPGNRGLCAWSGVRGCTGPVATRARSRTGTGDRAMFPITGSARSRAAPVRSGPGTAA